jgi:hypothetical protein
MLAVAAGMLAGSHSHEIHASGRAPSLK